MERKPLSARTPRTIFHLSCDPNGRWHVIRSDDLVGGTFFDREGAMRFARRETRPGTVLLLVMRQPPRRIAMADIPNTQMQVAK